MTFFSALGEFFGRGGEAGAESSTMAKAPATEELLRGDVDFCSAPGGARPLANINDAFDWRKGDTQQIGDTAVTKVGHGVVQIDRTPGTLTHGDVALRMGNGSRAFGEDGFYTDSFLLRRDGGISVIRDDGGLEGMYAREQPVHFINPGEPGYQTVRDDLDKAVNNGKLEQAAESAAAQQSLETSRAAFANPDNVYVNEHGVPFAQVQEPFELHDGSGRAARVGNGSWLVATDGTSPQNATRFEVFPGDPRK